jgi:hypothetical protein
VQSNIPDAAKWLVIAATSFVIIIGLIAVIRRVNVLRFLFGMKPLRRLSQEAPAVLPVAQ